MKARIQLSSDLSPEMLLHLSEWMNHKQFEFMHHPEVNIFLRHLNHM